MTIQKGDYVLLEGLSPREIREISLAFEAAGAERGRGWPYEDGECWDIIGLPPTNRVTRENLGTFPFGRLLSYADAVGYTPGEGEKFEVKFRGGDDWKLLECTAVGEQYILAINENGLECVTSRWGDEFRKFGAAELQVDLEETEGGTPKARAERLWSMGWRKEQ